MAWGGLAICGHTKAIGIVIVPRQLPGALPLEPDILTAAKPLAGGLADRGDPHAPKGGRRHAQGRPRQHLCRRTVHYARGQHVVERIAQPQFLAEVRAKGKLLSELIEEINSPHIVDVAARG